MKAQTSERHQQGQTTKKRQQPKASSMFASSTSRPHQIQKATGPSPGDYEVCSCECELSESSFLTTNVCIRSNAHGTRQEHKARSNPASTE
ncbi:unnamed protein product [Phytophthora fragariaefolia]|uniref:Unnamed protein product n=1 Tax=Phytophthora fragariaefolia TaxID=1490495 RepID=A0A9W6XDT1_9STRA|nr:unnamed protein product [Phytophthora fragariaefolia]